MSLSLIFSEFHILHNFEEQEYNINRHKTSNELIEFINFHSTSEAFSQPSLGVLVSQHADSESAIIRPTIARCDAMMTGLVDSPRPRVECRTNLDGAGSVFVSADGEMSGLI